MKDQIKPFHSINGLILGECTLGDLTFLLGSPEEEEITPTKEMAGDKYGGNKVVKYISRGIFAIIEENEVLKSDSKIDGIYVERPFSGVSPEGLYLGMPQKDAMQILKKNFILNYEDDPTYIFWKNERDAQDFQIWFEDEKLIRMKVERSYNEDEN